MPHVATLPPPPPHHYLPTDRRWELAFPAGFMVGEALDTSGGGPPVYGRLARAALTSRRHAESNAVLGALVASWDDTAGVVGARWLTESARAATAMPASAAAATSGAAFVIPVAPQQSASRAHHHQPHHQQRHHPHHAGGRATRDDKSRGPAFDHLLQQSNNLTKRLKDAHGHLTKAFDAAGAAGAGANKHAMTATLRAKSGQLALKCVAEALPVAESLLHNWDNAWGSQMHHLTARAESADVELEKMREQTEAALAEAEAYRAETVRREGGRGFQGWMGESW